MTVKVHSGLCMKYSRWDIYSQLNPTCCIGKTILGGMYVLHNYYKATKPQVVYAITY